MRVAELAARGEKEAALRAATMRSLSSLGDRNEIRTSSLPSCTHLRFEGSCRAVLRAGRALLLPATCYLLPATCYLLPANC